MKFGKIEPIQMLVLFAILLSFFVCRSLNSRIPENKNVWENYLTPLDDQTRLDLCISFQIDLGDRLCDPAYRVFAPEFYPIIEENLINETRQEIEAKLGKYKQQCPGSSMSYYCYYDLNGDQKSRIIVNYWADGTQTKRGIEYENIWDD
ncbi:MAG: hypothetical protein OEY93_09535 [Anaerolineae bacterium]|nr:hypothetical protein [Anaerolineae bacterium]